jgi:hypothetical protein
MARTSARALERKFNCLHLQQFYGFFHCTAKDKMHQFGFSATRGSIDKILPAKKMKLSLTKNEVGVIFLNFFYEAK